MAQFQVAQTQAEAHALILQGSLLTGSIVKGMNLHIPLNRSTTLTAEISGVHYRPDNGRHDVVIDRLDAEEVELLTMLILLGEVLEIQ